MSALRRVLVLGGDGHGRSVRGIRWDALPAGLNVADYDIVILNFRPLEDEAVAAAVLLDHLPRAEQFARLIFSSDALVVAIGDPDKFVGDRRTGYLQVTWWLPADLPLRHAKGEVFEVLDDGWAFWFNRLKSYDWHFVDRPAINEFQHPEACRALPGAEGIVPKWSPVAVTRAGDPIAARLQLLAIRQVETGWGVKEWETVASSDSVVWLPPLPLSDGEMIELLLTELGVLVETAPPAWVSSYTLPHQRAAQTDVAKRQQAVGEAQSALDIAEERLTVESRFAMLLYEQGKEVLEPVVRDALSVLGATVQEPAAAGIEDGRLTDPAGRQAMLEIKGKRGQLGVDDVRQLGGWIQNAMAGEGWDGKGIVVANLFLELPPEERRDVIAPNAETFASRIGIAIVTTPQLYEALRQQQDGKLNVGAFWDAIFESVGLVDLPNAAPSERLPTAG